MNKVTAEETLKSHIGELDWDEFKEFGFLKRTLKAMKAYAHQSSVSDEDLVTSDNNNIKVPCDAPFNSINSIEQIWNVTKTGYRYRDFEAENLLHQRTSEQKAEQYANNLFPDKTDGKIYYRWLDRKWGYYDALRDIYYAMMNSVLNPERSVATGDDSSNADDNQNPH